MTALASVAPGASLPVAAFGLVLRGQGAADIPDWVIAGLFTVFVLWAVVLMWQLVYTTICDEHRARRLESIPVAKIDDEPDRRLAPVPDHDAVPGSTG